MQIFNEIVFFQQYNFLNVSKQNVELFFLIFPLNLLKYFLAEEQGNWKISLKSNP